MVNNDNVDVIVSDVVDFCAYVESFYGNVPNAVYPIGASPKMIIAATSKYIKSLNDKSVLIRVRHSVKNNAKKDAIRP